jgi:hypothetical protein
MDMPWQPCEGHTTSEMPKLDGNLGSMCMEPQVEIYRVIKNCSSIALV